MVPDLDRRFNIGPQCFQLPDFFVELHEFPGRHGRLCLAIQRKICSQQEYSEQHIQPVGIFQCETWPLPPLPGSEGESNISFSSSFVFSSPQMLFIWDSTAVSRSTSVELARPVCSSMSRYARRDAEQRSPFSCCNCRMAVLMPSQKYVENISLINLDRVCVSFTRSSFLIFLTC